MNCICLWTLQRTDRWPNNIWLNKFFARIILKKEKKLKWWTVPNFRLFTWTLVLNCQQLMNSFRVAMWFTSTEKGTWLQTVLPRRLLTRRLESVSCILRLSSLSEKGTWHCWSLKLRMISAASAASWVFFVLFAWAFGSHCTKRKIISWGVEPCLKLFT